MFRWPLQLELCTWADIWQVLRVICRVGQKIFTVMNSESMWLWVQMVGLGHRITWRRDRVGTVRSRGDGEARKSQNRVFDRVWGCQNFSLPNPITSKFMGLRPLGDVRGMRRREIWGVSVRKNPFYSWFSPFYMPPRRGPYKFCRDAHGSVLLAPSRARS